MRRRFRLGKPRRKLKVARFGPVGAIKSSGRSHLEAVGVGRDRKVKLVRLTPIGPDAPAFGDFSAADDFTIGIVVGAINCVTGSALRLDLLQICGLVAATGRDCFGGVARRFGETYRISLLSRSPEHRNL